MTTNTELSDEQIELLAKEAGFGFFGQWMLWQGDTNNLHAFARAILAAPSGIEADGDGGNTPYDEGPFTLSPTSNGKTADGVEACPTCRGEGEVDERIGGDPFAANVATCPDCNGTGNAAVDASRGGEHG